MTAVTDEELLARLPGVLIDNDNAAYYRGWFARQLVLSRCLRCGWWHHPPKPVCPRCWSDQVVPTAVGGTGTIHLLIWLHQGPAADGVDYSSPHPVATIELDEQPGLRVTSTVLGARPGDIGIGDRVRLAWTERGGAPYPAFVPAGAD